MTSADLSPITVDVSVSSTREVPLLMRFLWFLFIGLWLGGLMVPVAWIACISIIGLPVGLWLFDRLPQIMTLKQPETRVRALPRDGFFYLAEQRPEQLPLVIRLLWFLAIGWWALGVWLSLAWLLTLSIFGTPIAFWMINRVPKVLWLSES